MNKVTFPFVWSCCIYSNDDPPASNKQLQRRWCFCFGGGWIPISISVFCTPSVPDYSILKKSSNIIFLKIQKFVGIRYTPDIFPVTINMTSSIGIVEWVVFPSTRSRPSDSFILIPPQRDQKPKKNSKPHTHHGTTHSTIQFHPTINPLNSSIRSEHWNSPNIFFVGDWTHVDVDHR